MIKGIILGLLAASNFWCYLVAYFLGAVPFGLLIGKYFGKVDIKSAGSGSIGATNVLRVLKETDPKKAKILAILTVVCDALKGVVPILVARAMGFDENVLWGMAVFAVVGHCFSPYLGFSGGKGVATGAGVLACFVPIELIIALVVWFIVGKVLKISSVASLSAALALIVASYILHADMPAIHTHAPIFIIVFIVFYKHIPNIARLLRGEEKRVI
ncbi:glycerol-3-phosphate 1-O-acyltransferase PlsY [Campylobacter sp. JMF_01 NE2]|uniref:glycerol-3-phosphate 1-O-acyltransferase PlsY n=1 Tax=unclassified Campylobacter TaxID=2593542 RepID=UPI0022E9DBCA|nr:MULTISPECIES: glycerol-3-phosphate 1-O-acyltransferase PlsY [unclassified Campylobacter]MDA3048710.1 glycerol-3-phosphate 1-O-acyltransferase PlsY [Campylobacter sp. JMF_08 NE1]MDA3053430.1 glycerol-3-phosphate 1-O-acyltransferase PlsY [Campylobacter sp. JMF_03 NE3]MDA3067832.1 glycerol-3-phosphate 1-O-acyltransferase PlsY [Campylobacter sp. JMF_01 NE2]MDA3078770.1 glycerol-3-phosphate 1-O-acyltransferase PlsY [Campylobacter sp. JMF_06 NA1]